MSIERVLLTVVSTPTVFYFRSLVIFLLLQSNGITVNAFLHFFTVSLPGLRSFASNRVHCFCADSER